MYARQALYQLSHISSHMSYYHNLKVVQKCRDSGVGWPRAGGGGQGIETKSCSLTGLDLWFDKGASCKQVVVADVQQPDWI